MAHFYILFAIFLWSSLGIVIRLTVVPVHILIFYALIISCMLQGTYIIAKGHHHDISGGTKIKYPLILGIVSAVNMLTFYFAFKATTVANAVLTHYTAPVIVAFLATVFLKEKVSWPLIYAMLIASAGLWIMLNGISIGEGQAAGIASGTISGVAYAIIVILGRLYARLYHPVVLTFLVNSTIVILLAPFIREFPRHAIWSYLFMGVVHSTIAPVLYYRGLRDVNATRTAVLGYLEPLCAILLAMFFLHEMPDIRSLYGGILILFSGYLSIRAKHAATS
jgi:drug/metabolite transporter (DMT)-like permease